LSPHYKKNVYDSDKVVNNFYKIKSRVRDFGIDLYLGYEVFLVSSINDVLLQKDKYTLNKSKYLLFELPFDIMPVGINETVLKLHSEG